MRSCFHFSINKALRKVLSLEIPDQRSYKGLILSFTEVFNILKKFSFKEINNTFFKSFSLLKIFQFLFRWPIQKCMAVLIFQEQGFRKVLV